MKTIDAENKILGRIASEAATTLLGKDSVDYAPNKIGGKVHITNASKLSIAPKKENQMRYKRYTGYPGGLKYEKLTELIAKKGYSEVIKRAVKKMLPSNKLRDGMLKNLKVTE
ncbi:MAG: large subunit ribosomal protein L13 [Candidatus Paceibacteria bacterium]|jgi:large subunit ribosomal protein L13